MENMALRHLHDRPQYNALKQRIHCINWRAQQTLKLTHYVTRHFETRSRMDDIGDQDFRFGIYGRPLIPRPHKPALVRLLRTQRLSVGYPECSLASGVGGGLRGFGDNGCILILIIYTHMHEEQTLWSHSSASQCYIFGVPSSGTVLQQA